LRYGVLADIHGNLPALEAVLNAVDAHRPDAILCVGDLVGYGAFPSECVDRIASLARGCVAGDHDLVAIGRQPEHLLDDLGAETSGWTKEALTEGARDYLSTLPLHLELGPVVLAHASLRDPWRRVGPAAAEDELLGLGARRPDASILVLGHTHTPLAYCEGVGSIPREDPVKLVPGRKYVLNPGAVGQSHESSPVARCLVLDLTDGSAIFLAVPYDAERYVAELRSSGLPPDAHHRPVQPRPDPLGDALGRARLEAGAPRH
jgi:predicted phosphodiesterase